MNHHWTRATRARPDAVQYLRRGMEGVVLVLAVLSPWAFGGVDPVFELVLAAALVVVLALWATIAVLNSRFSWMRCSVTVCAAVVFLSGILQLVPLPSWLLHVVSPGTANLYAELSPTDAEVLAPDVFAAVPSLFHSISVYPHATRVELFRWLGLVVLFAGVRNQVASTASFRRLAIALTVNGALLAVLGIAQAFSSPQGAVYWNFPTAGQVFGPFINRNHFAGYLNLCIAMGTGLLLLTGPSDLDRRRSIIRKPNALQEQEEEEGVLFSPLAVLHSPDQLWVCVALALMLAGLVCSLSRGGLAALLLALAACVGLRLLVGRRMRVRRLESLVVPAALMLALLAWLNVRPLETRLGNIFRGDPVEDSRWNLWSQLLRLVPRFPIFGSGAGTVSYVEPITRTRGVYITSAATAEPNYTIEHAHNDYLEALVEGGVVRFGLTLLAVGLVFNQGFRALRRFAGRTPGAYAFAGMLGFLAVALHAAVDFSLATPAVAIVTAIVVAQLVTLNRADPTTTISAADRHVLTWRLPPVGKAGVVAAALLLGALLMLHALQIDLVHRLRVGAYLQVRGYPNQTSEPDYDKALTYLADAARTDPDDADLQLEYGQVYLDARQDQVRQWREPRNFIALRLAVSSNNALAGAVAFLASQDLQRLPSARESELFEHFVVPGLEHMALARRLCPLLARPHIRFAAFAPELVSADPPAAYWARARLLAPYDAELWYYNGVQQLRDGNIDEAFASWRRSLELSGLRLNAIIDEVGPRRPADRQQRVEVLMTKVLPEDAPEFDLLAALRLDPEPTAKSAVRPLFERGRDLLTRRTDALDARDYYTLARCRQFLGDTKRALADFDQALAMAPNHADWRREYIDLLIDEELWKKALDQLQELKQQAPYSGIDDDIQRVREKLGPRS